MSTVNPFRGEPISVVVSGQVIRARAHGYAIHNDERMLRWRQTRRKSYGRVRLQDEGATWCRGWKGSQVTAMRTVAALRRASDEQERQERMREFLQR